jgi:hypothetical protein
VSWLRLEDNMLDHPKWRRALRMGGNDVVATWVRLVSWCSRNLTDGRVPADMVAQVAEVRSVERSRSLRALADAGLIQFSHGSDTGLTSCSPGSDVLVTDYLQRNPSRSQVLEERSRRSESQRKRRGAHDEAGTVTGHAKTSEADCNEVPARPGPSHIDLREEEERDLPRATSVPGNVPEPTTSPFRRKSIFAPDDFAPTESHRVRCQELALDVGELARAFKRHEFNREYSDWDRRFAKWIEDERIKRETERGKALKDRQSTAPAEETWL